MKKALDKIHGENYFTLACVLLRMCAASTILLGIFRLDWGRSTEKHEQNIFIETIFEKMRFFA
jgi:hypothetical protein